MSDRPIIMSGPMVRAILDGRKTQTRRVLHKKLSLNALAVFGRKFGYAPGDRLWVRETWAQHHPAGVQEGRFSIKGRAGIPGPPGVTYRVIYRADGDPLRVWHCDGYPYRTITGPRDDIDARHPDVCSEFPGWASPLHMPRWASRITLHVTDVRVQRVQEISTDDCLAEGIDANEAGLVTVQGGPAMTAKAAYRDLWDSLNAKRGCGWEQNPWVVALTFRAELRNIDQCEAP